MGSRARPSCRSGFLPFLLFWGIAIAAPSSEDSTDDSSVVFAFDSILDIVHRISIEKNWNPEDIRISHIDFDDARFTKTTIYELDIQIGDLLFPAKFTGEIPPWQRLGDLDVGYGDAEHEGKVTKDLWNSEVFGAVLAPFQIAGSVNLLFSSPETPHIPPQDKQNIGVIERVTVDDGNTVLIEGAQELSLTHPLEFPLYINSSLPAGSLVASILSLAAGVRHAEDEEAPKLSFHIVGSTLVASITGLDSTVSRTERKELEYGNLKLLYKVGNQAVESSNSMASRNNIDEASIWPFPSLNSSDAKLLILEEILRTYLGSKVYKQRPFTILRAKMAALTFVLFELEIERKLIEDDFKLELWPDWKTRPTIEKCKFQVLAKVQYKTLTPIMVRRLKRYMNVETYTWRDFTSNVSYTRFSSFLVPSSPMTLDID